MYRAGDFTVTPIPDGYMVGRLIEKGSTTGPWWEYIKAETTFDRAVDFARELAERAAVRAWIYESPNVFYEITRSRRPADT